MTGEPMWPWLVLAGLGAYHGVNPAMGWLFAVGLGLNRGSRAVVLASLVPLALGHALAITATVAVVALAGRVVEPGLVEALAGIALVGWGFYHLVATPRHRLRVGMGVGFLGLAAWSALMGLAHGAGLMLVPVLSEWPVAHAHGHGLLRGETTGTVLAAVGLHTLAMIAVTGLVAIVIYEWVGLGILRRGWINLDLLWAGALVAAGAILLLA